LQEEIEYKQVEKTTWLTEHTLTKEQVKQLILNKLDRAQASCDSLKKREMLCGDR
jgi:hypothetical protein